MIKTLDEPPSSAGHVARAYPTICLILVWEACAQAGPIDLKAFRPVKLLSRLGALQKALCTFMFAAR
jgi:hypothetical protein